MKEIKKIKKEFGSLLSKKGSGQNHYHLQHKFNAIKTGIRSKEFKQLYGCHTCSFRGTELCSHSIKDGKTHANGICSDRAKFFSYYIKRAKGDRLPFMIERLVRIETLAYDFLIQEIEQHETPSMKWIALQKIVIDYDISLYKLEERWKRKIEKRVTFEDIRKMFVKSWKTS